MQQNQEASLAELYSRLAHCKREPAIYRQKPFPGASALQAANDDEWGGDQATKNCTYFARFMPLIAQYITIFGAIFRKLKQKIFSPNFPVAALATLILLGFAACSARGFAYDNMSGTPQAA